MYTGVDSPQDVVGAQSESADVEGKIRHSAKQMRWVFDGDGGWLLDPLTEFTPETAKKKRNHEKGWDENMKKEQMEQVPVEH